MWYSFRNSLGDYFLFIKVTRDGFNEDEHLRYLEEVLPHLNAFRNNVLTGSWPPYDTCYTWEQVERLLNRDVGKNKAYIYDEEKRDFVYYGLASNKLKRWFKDEKDNTSVIHNKPQLDNPNWGLF